MQKEEIEFKAPGGIGMIFRGSNALPITLAICLGLLVWTLIGQSDSKAEAREQKSETRDFMTTEALKNLTEAVRRQEEMQKVLVYVMSLPQPERDRLNLMKPKMLLEMQK